MAAISVNGCVKNSKIDVKMKLGPECNGISKTLNGSIGSHKNGLINCRGEGDYLMKENVKVKGAVIPRINWSQHDCFSGSFEKCTLLTAILTNLGLYFLMFLSYLNQALFKPSCAIEKNREGYAPLYNPFEKFFSHHVYRRVKHCFSKPITSHPGAEIMVKEWISEDYNWTFKFTGKQLRCINLGSYNYLGYGGCLEAGADEASKKYGLSLCSPRAELGTSALHEELETTLAEFLGVEAAIVFGMGFATNSLGLPGLLGPSDLVLSDENNHASLIIGLRMARVTAKVFRHNDMFHLEEMIRQHIAMNKWSRIIVVVEGVYSMEGSIVPLPAIVALKRRYNVYIYLDEAHSIGAIGPHGRGVTDLHGVDPKDIDVLMGTFTKSFGSAGGYIAGSRRLVNWIRAHGHAHTYAHGLSAPLAKQVLWTTQRLANGDAAPRLAALKENTTYFRRRLSEMGVVTCGHPESPVVPMLVYTFSKMSATVERLSKNGVAVVGVGYPATPLNKARIRFCISAAHTREQLDRSLEALERVVDELGLRYARR